MSPSTSGAPSVNRRHLELERVSLGCARPKTLSIGCSAPAWRTMNVAPGRREASTQSGLTGPGCGFLGASVLNPFAFQPVKGQKVAAW